MNVLRTLGVAGALILVPFVAFGIWLLATPDYDGGRRAVGGLIVAAAGIIVLAYGAWFFVVRSRRRSR
jgi:hypothetical protein